MDYFSQAALATWVSKLGIAIEEGKQSVRGSPQEKAKDLAIAVYNSRNSQ